MRGLPRETLNDSRRQILGIGSNRLAVAAFLAGSKFQPEASGGGIPLALPAQNMQRVGRRDAADMGETPRGQTIKRRFLRRGSQKLGERLRLLGDPGVKRGFLRGKTCSHRIRQAGADREQAFMALGMDGTDLLFQRRNDNLGKAVADQAERQDAARAEFDARDQAGEINSHFRIATEPVSSHGHRFDHRPVAADHGAIGIELRPTVLQNGDIGRGAADIADDGAI